MEEIGRDPNTVYGTSHARGYLGVGIGAKTSVKPGALEQRFRVYEIDWSPSTIRWKLDGRTYFVARKSQLRPGQAWPFDQPFYIIINLAVGGEWPGLPNRHTHFPAKLLSTGSAATSSAPARNPTKPSYGQKSMELDRLDTVCLPFDRSGSRQGRLFGAERLRS